ncbi:hypothetical protein IFM89_027271 [Coptis chinensis]|uniref:AAA+ ATPase domain-containing protein n=1 Tax=Coptis chinensis TaxID=261450 RepID=A0A835IPT7_9MAGN|nr:hypothetical protein IFM89_027271 [Coptis chinensis]
MVDVMKDLQLHRQSRKAFAGKHGFITPRDLFRWANHFRELGISKEDLAKDGYFLLAESVIWTRSMQRLYFLVERCNKLREPVLLVGETGGGKTTVCQLLSTDLKRNLNILNCHQFTDTSDFLGGFYPVRDRSVLTLEFKHIVEQLMLSNVVLRFPEIIALSSDIGEASLTFRQLNDITNTYRIGRALHTDVAEGDLVTFEQMKLNLVELHQKWQTIFTWHDGPLVQSMKNGDLFLVDEISLADDSILERLNSVLELEQKLSLAEKGGSMLENITAHPNFFLLAKMNPGGDFGKKELSPALQNRFTEVWVPPVSEMNELRSIALSCVGKSLSYTVDPMLKFWEWFSQLHTSRTLTVRDLLSWVDFMNTTVTSFESPNYALLHGAFLVLLNGLSLGYGFGEGNHSSMAFDNVFFDRAIFIQRIHNYLNCKFGWDAIGRSKESMLDNVVQSHKYFGIAPFKISKGDDDCKPEDLNSWHQPPVEMQCGYFLLEGSPGVGKTSLGVAIGKYSGHRVVRINLSEQTDIMDLLGSDLPVEDVEGMRFAWSDGILLQALKNGDWGLTAILDHRAEVFIPELGQTYKCPTSFRVFACQNPSCQGGGRKGLPKSFLNRFTKVWALLDKNFFSLLISARKLILFIFSRMHTAADRQEVVKLYAEVFGVKPFINPYPRLQVNPRYLIVGNTVIERNRFQPSETLKSQLSILPGIRHSLESVAHCVQHQWLCILVGPSASGKSTVVRLLADLTVSAAITQVERYIDEYCSLSLELEDIVLERKDLVSKWFKLLSSMYGNLTAASASAYADTKDLNKVLKSLKDLLDYTKKEAAPTKFEWVTGMSIKAIECGEWIVLENANLCNPTVLDRINSLVEPSGSITVNERGHVEGRPMVLRPKCKFRIFLTVNIKYGEVSRAMRNRGVEVFMMQPDWLHEGEDGYKQKGTRIYDVKRFLVLSGISLSVLVDVMTEAHMFARDTSVHLGVQITLLELSHWLELVQVGSCLRFSLSLPGGWPTPLKLRNFVLHSKEASVRQNCMYLEFLVAQSASYELSGSHNGDLTMQRSPMNGAGHMSTSSLNSGSTSSFNKLHPSLIPLKMLLPVLFPTTPYQLNSGSTNLPNFDLALRLYNSVVCAELLRHSLQQWNAEDDHSRREENTFSPVLESLRELEKDVLDKLVDSSSFDLLFQIYSNVIEHHSLVWNGIISSKYECLILSWRSLKKYVMKLQSFFPKAVENLLVRSTGLGNISAWNLQSVKSMLWVNSGHPLLPSSADTYSMRQQLLQFFQLGWPTNTISWKQASSGVCMTSFLTSKEDLDDASEVQQLDEMHQILLRRFEYETQKLEAVLMPIDQSFLENDLSACCVLCPEKFHKKLSLSSWQEMFCLFDSTSFFSDMELLKEFSSAILVDSEELYKVKSKLKNDILNYRINFFAILLVTLKDQGGLADDDFFIFYGGLRYAQTSQDAMEEKDMKENFEGVYYRVFLRFGLRDLTQR